MAVLGSIIKGAINITSRIPVRKNVYKQQVKQLQKLLTKAQFTAFGTNYEFNKILVQEDPIKLFQQNVPIYDYQSIFDGWSSGAHETSSFVI